ncbi:LAMI_0E10506g1_1 [Lachancea mirantina]|uniref:LAMI_0E10506g1_1 n=1 Tax=Lachancea mirantina TaxID=1230905 RepID=A0A1G4JP19_9SACH|nr:LAMI_0E10506g1_1 [Lachancea mirantina]
MIFGLGRLFYVVLLLINAVAVLSEERFLRRIGLVAGSNQGAVFGQQENTAKSKVVQLISAVQTLLRIPLIGINILVIGYELLLG